MTNQSQAGELPVVIVGAGPIGLTAALGLHRYGIPVVVLEEDLELSRETKAGTILTRTLEVFDRYGVVEPVLRAALRIDEIGEINRATNARGNSVRTDRLREETRHPFVINLPQGSLEEVLEGELRRRDPEALRLGHQVVGLAQGDAEVTLTVQTPHGVEEMRARYLLACDGGRSPIRTELGIEVAGTTLPERYMLVDLKVDLDLDNPRDYPYLAYFSDPQEWMILVRQPHCWRFLFPLHPDAPVPGEDDLKEKALRFIGEVDQVELLGTNVYTVHHRVAEQWQVGRVLLMGDAAHLITPMWALGLNTGVLDASNLPWRLAWVLRGWADPELLSGYEAEQSTVAIRGSGQMAENARQAMGSDQALEVGGGDRGLALTRTLLGVSLDVEGTGRWSMVADGDADRPLAAGDRIPDLVLHGPDGGRHHLHDLAAETFLALHFTDARRRPLLPESASPGLRHVVVSRWDAPHDSGIRAQSFFDPGDHVRRRLGVTEDAVVLLRPDGHVAGIQPWTSGEQTAEQLYHQIVRPAAADQLLGAGAGRQEQ